MKLEKGIENNNIVMIVTKNRYNIQPSGVSLAYKLNTKFETPDIKMREISVN